MNYLELLKELANKAQGNVNSSNDMVVNQSKLAGKKIDDESYQSTPEESNNEDAYYNALNGAMMGSVAPTSKLYGPVVEKAEQSISGLNKGMVSQEMLEKAQQSISRARDFEDRLKSDRARAGFERIKKYLGK